MDLPAIAGLTGQFGIRLVKVDAAEWESRGSPELSYRVSGTSRADWT